MIAELVGVPAETHAKGHPAAGQMIQCGNGFRQRDRVVLDW